MTRLEEIKEMVEIINAVERENYIESRIKEAGISRVDFNKYCALAKEIYGSEVMQYE